eukprot:969442-Prorocentrum_minimum.AAC.3
MTNCSHSTAEVRAAFGHSDNTAAETQSGSTQSDTSNTSSSRCVPFVAKVQLTFSMAKKRLRPPHIERSPFTL